MIRLSVCIVILYSILEYADANNERSAGLIINGRDAPSGKYSWQIVLYYKRKRNYHFICGGSILNKKYVITAAHCIFNDDPSRYQIAVGKHELEVDESYTQYINIRRLIIHENYISIYNGNDIALLRLKTRIVYDDDYVQPVNLAGFGETPPTRRCFASGFGVVNENTDAVADTLQELKTIVVTKNRCKKVAGNYGAEHLITDKVVCTKDRRKGVCSGDSGGPIGCFDRDGNYTQYGVLSWGSTRCVSGFNVYTRVSEYADWIADNM